MNVQLPKRHAVERVHFGGGHPLVHEIDAAVPRLLHLIPVPHRPLQVEDRQVARLECRIAGVNRHARFVQRSHRSSRVIDDAVVDESHGFPERAVIREILAVLREAAPEVIEAALDHPPRNELVCVLLEERSGERRRRQFVGIRAPQEVVAVVVARGVEETPARLLGEPSHRVGRPGRRRFEQDDLRKATADLARRVGRHLIVDDHDVAESGPAGQRMLEHPGLVPDGDERDDLHAPFRMVD